MSCCEHATFTGVWCSIDATPVNSIQSKPFVVMPTPFTNDEPTGETAQATRARAGSALFAVIMTKVVN